MLCSGARKSAQSTLWSPPPAYRLHFCAPFHQIRPHVKALGERYAGEKPPSSEPLLLYGETYENHLPLAPPVASIFLSMTH